MCSQVFKLPLPSASRLCMPGTTTYKTFFESFTRYVSPLAYLRTKVELFESNSFRGYTEIK